MSESGEQDLVQRRAIAEIDKLEAEAAALRRPPNPLTNNWLPLLAGLGGFLTAMGALSAVFTAWASLATVNIAKARNVVEADAKVVQADRHQFEAERKSAQVEEQIATRTKLLNDQVKASEAMLADAQGKLATAKAKVADSQNFLEDLKRQAVSYDAQIASVKRQFPQAQVKFQKGLVFLQFRDEKTRAVMTGFQGKLKEWGFAAPGVQLVSGDFGNSVKYFREPQDQKVAIELASSVNAFLAKTCGKHPAITAQYAPTGNPTAEFEVWVNFACAPPAKA